MGVEGKTPVKLEYYRLKIKQIDFQSQNFELPRRTWDENPSFGKNKEK